METVFRKANQLHKFGGETSQVTVIVEVGGKFHVYRSSEIESWPPPMAEIVSLIE